MRVQGRPTGQVRRLLPVPASQGVGEARGGQVQGHGQVGFHRTGRRHVRGAALLFQVPHSGVSEQTRYHPGRDGIEAEDQARGPRRRRCGRRVRQGDLPAAHQRRAPGGIPRGCV